MQTCLLKKLNENVLKKAKIEFYDMRMFLFFSREGNSQIQMVFIYGYAHTGDFLIHDKSNLID